MRTASALQKMQVLMIIVCVFWISSNIANIVMHVKCNNVKISERASRPLLTYGIHILQDGWITNQRQLQVTASSLNFEVQLTSKSSSKISGSLVIIADYEQIQFSTPGQGDIEALEITLLPNSTKLIPIELLNHTLKEVSDLWVLFLETIRPEDPISLPTVLGIYRKLVHQDGIQRNDSRINFADVHSTPIYHSAVMSTWLSMEGMSESMMSPIVVDHYDSEQITFDINVEAKEGKYALMLFKDNKVLSFADDGRSAVYFQFAEVSYTRFSVTCHDIPTTEASRLLAVAFREPFKYNNDSSVESVANVAIGSNLIILLPKGASQ